MKPNRFKLAAFAIALSTASLFAQDPKRITPPPPLPPRPLDVETIAARRAIILSRAKAADATNVLAVGAPGLTKGVDSGGQTNAAKAGGVVAGKVPIVSGSAVIGSALPVGTASPAAAPSPATTSGNK